MAKIIITLEDSDDIPATLRDIAGQAEDGFTSGYYPTWELSD